MAFSDKFTPLPFTSEWDLMQTVNHVSRMSFSTTDCSLPMVWATEKKKEFDVFMVFTDSETYAGKVKIIF
jgi:60 kDa SS-A/Ro ribonucleoprotein